MSYPKYNPTPGDAAARWYEVTAPDGRRLGVALPVAPRDRFSRADLVSILRTFAFSLIEDGLERLPADLTADAEIIATALWRQCDSLMARVEAGDDRLTDPDTADKLDALWTAVTWRERAARIAARRSAREVAAA
jgi:hypothetical protein